jgi:hypothetical protein
LHYSFPGEGRAAVAAYAGQTHCSFLGKGLGPKVVGCEYAAAPLQICLSIRASVLCACVCVCVCAGARVCAIN